MQECEAICHYYIYYGGLGLVSENNKYSKGAKNMELKYFGSEHRVLIEHITLNLMIVDILMKGFPSKVFGSHVENMGMNYNILLMYIWKPCCKVYDSFCLLFMKS
uniref:Uncharacterized protein n=1 Tax=Medicago truncatula TaxID=3880 RepID=A2Q2A5_MEDTR|nr:hypothetical protein MtrDRAFT_AC149601g19v2 [Medicago truncatula]